MSLDPFDFASQETDPVEAPSTGKRLFTVGARSRETTRRWLAGTLVGLFTATCLLSLVAVIAEWVPHEDVKSLLEVLIPPIVALTGSAVGFYFGVERGESS